MPSQSRSLPKDLDPAVRNSLTTGGVIALDALWCGIGQGDNHQGLADLVNATHAPRQPLIAGLTDYAVSRGKEKGKSWPRRHALDLLLVAVLLLLGGLVWRAALRARAIGIAQRDLPAGERLNAGALFAPGHDSLSSFRVRRRAVQGEYVLPQALERIPSAVTDKELLGRYRLALRVPRTDAERLTELPTLASLAVCSPGGNGRQATQQLLHEVPIVAVDRQGNVPTITAALTLSDLQKVLPLLSDAKVWVVQP
jgi:hypothetical protein